MRKIKEFESMGKKDFRNIAMNYGIKIKWWYSKKKILKIMDNIFNEFREVLDKELNSRRDLW